MGVENVSMLMDKTKKRMLSSTAPLIDARRKERERERGCLRERVMRLFSGWRERLENRGEKMRKKEEWTLNVGGRYNTLIL